MARTVDWSKFQEGKLYGPGIYSDKHFTPVFGDPAAVKAKYGDPLPMPGDPVYQKYAATPSGYDSYSMDEIMVNGGGILPSEYGINLNNLKPVMAKNPSGGGMDFYQDSQGKLFSDPNGKNPASAPAGWQIIGGQTYEQALGDTSTPRLINGQIVSGTDALAQQQTTRDLYNAETAKNAAQTAPAYTELGSRQLGINQPGSTDQGAGAGGAGAGGTSSGGGSDSNQFLSEVANALATKPPVIQNNGSITIKPEDIATYLEQAKSLIDPYYHQLITQAQTDLTRGLSEIGQDLTTSERTLGQKYGQSLESSQEAMARRGLTDSSIRNTAERTLAENTTAAIEAGRVEAARRAQEIGQKSERYLGTTNLPTDLPTTTNAPAPITNTAGVYGLTPSTGTRSLYTPVTNTLGTLQQEQTIAEQTKAKNLGSDQQTLQASLTK